MAPTRRWRSAHDPGRVLRDLIVSIADGGDCLADPCCADNPSCSSSADEHGRVVRNIEIPTLAEEERRHLCELDWESSAILLPWMAWSATDGTVNSSVRQSRQEASTERRNRRSSGTLHPPADVGTVGEQPVIESPINPFALEDDHAKTTA